MVGYDYTQNGAYFITICTNDRLPVLWNDNKVITNTCPDGTHYIVPLSDAGRIAETEIDKLNHVYGNTVEVINYVIMPNHIHLLLLLKKMEDDPCKPPSISRIIQQFKGSITKQLQKPIWQRSFHDHVVRNQEEYERIWQYIEINPLVWEKDLFYVEPST